MMRNFIFLIGITLFFMHSLIYADEAPDLIATDKNKWTLQPSDPLITLDNPTGDQIFITIQVDRGNNIGGIDVYNCGEGIVHLDPGSAVTCDNTDSNSPVKFEADTSGKVATGTYSIDQR